MHACLFFLGIYVSFHSLCALARDKQRCYSCVNRIRFKSTPRPDRRAPFIQHPWNGHHCHGQERKNARCPPNAQLLIHWNYRLVREQRRWGEQGADHTLNREERESATQCIPHKSIRGNGRRGCQSGIGINQIHASANLRACQHFVRKLG